MNTTTTPTAASATEQGQDTEPSTEHAATRSASSTTPAQRWRVARDLDVCAVAALLQGDIERALAHDGRQLTWDDQGGVVLVTCPFHNDHRPSLRLDRGRNRWRCFACTAGAAGVGDSNKAHRWRSTIDLVMELRGLTATAARDLLVAHAEQGTLPTALATPAATAPAGAEHRARRDALADVLGHLDHIRQEPSGALTRWATRRGFGRHELAPDVIPLPAWRWLETRTTPAVLTAAGLLTPRGTPLWWRRDALIIWRDPHGHAVYAQAFETEPSPTSRAGYVKYLGPRGLAAPWPFGADHATRGGTHLWVCEGALDALKARLLAGAAAIGLPGATSPIPRRWLGLLKGFAVLVLAMDADPAGDLCAERFTATLTNYGWEWPYVRLRQTAEGTDISDSLHATP